MKERRSRKNSKRRGKTEQERIVLFQTMPLFLFPLSVVIFNRFSSSSEVCDVIRLNS